MGDALLFYSTNPPWHIGCAIGPETMIHANERVGVAVERFDSPLYRRRLEGAYRWIALESGQSESSR